MAKEISAINLYRTPRIEEEVLAEYGLTKRGSELLRIFLEGITEVERALPEMLVNKGQIRLLLELDGEDSQSTACACNDGLTGERLIIIARDFLNRTGRLMADRRALLLNSRKEVVFDGFLEDYVFLCGVEEAHHGYFPTDPPPRFKTGSVSCAVYDSQEHEFAALLCQLEIARQKMPDFTIKCLERRIAEAAEIRGEITSIFPAPEDILQ